MSTAENLTLDMMQARQTATEHHVPEIDERIAHVLDSHVEEIESSKKLPVTHQQPMPCTILRNIAKLYRGLQLVFIIEESINNSKLTPHVAKTRAADPS